MGIHRIEPPTARRGDVIARIDPETFEAKVTQAQADVESAEASVQNQQAQAEHCRANGQNARAAYAEAKAQTAKAQVAVVDARRDLDRKAQLFARQLIAKSELDTAQAAHDSAVARLDSPRPHEEAFASAIQRPAAKRGAAEAAAPPARARWNRRPRGARR